MPTAIKEAKKRIKSKKDFFNQLGSFVATAIFLIGINVFTSPGYMWAWWPIGFWGISLVFQAIKLVVDDKTSQWERKAMRQELESMGYDPDIYEDEDILDINEKIPHKVYDRSYRDSDLV